MDLNDTQLYYIRAMINRGIRSIESDNEKMRAELDNHPNMAATFREMGEGCIEYNEQMLRATYQFVPAELMGEVIR